jgi:hypothetical protein
MTAARLPGGGELRLGAVTLPAGKRVTGYGPEPVAWVTSQAVPEAGRVWAALWDAHPDSGLIPFLLGTLPGDRALPWESGLLGYPEEPARLDDHTTPHMAC